MKIIKTEKYGRFLTEDELILLGKSEKKAENDGPKDLIEELSDLEHEQWMGWAKDILKSEDITKERSDRWEEDSFKPYSELTEEQKDMDREWAEKVLKIVKKYMEEK
jgi:hypothetical protein